MTKEYLKKATLTSTSDAADVRDTVQGMLDAIRAGGDTTAMEFAAKFDRYDGNVIVTPAEIEAACAEVP
ncbi:MAG: histidinol dehydrogenase, partial [Boseongicola sp. SB0673_bin_14]|nr:histidinol dehydrogenase [Boseongicola sp. SB0673_bin_14]